MSDHLVDKVSQLITEDMTADEAAKIITHIRSVMGENQNVSVFTANKTSIRQLEKMRLTYISDLQIIQTDNLLQRRAPNMDNIMQEVRASAFVELLDNLIELATSNAEPK